MSRSAERIDEALRIVRATLGTRHEDAARAELAEAIRIARADKTANRRNP